jgi:NAD+ synthase (glutamine-hydrolysing)
MNILRFASTTINQTPLDWKNNQKNIINTISKAKQNKVEILCLPELCISGYGCEDAFHSKATITTGYEKLNQIVPETRGLVVCLGVAVLFRNAIYNCAVVIADGNILGFIPKQFLANDGIHYEARWFKAWKSGQQSHITINEQTYPIGDLCFEIDGIRFGCEICEDAWVSQRPGASLARKNVDVLFNPSASHFSFGKQEVRKRFVLEGSRAFGVTYLYSNLMGNEAGKLIYDGGSMIASNGTLHSSCPRFALTDLELCYADVDLELCRLSQARAHHTTQEIINEDPSIIVSSFKFSKTMDSPLKENFPQKWEKSEDIKYEEFTHAMTLGLFDYMRKSRSRGFVISISGGADSGALTCLVALMIQKLIHELSPNELSDKLKYLNLKNLDYQTLIKSLLVCIYQSTRNSGDKTLNAARLLCDGLEIPFHNIDVDSLVQNYVKTANSILGRELEWETDDLPLQNIQARVRAPGVWLIANVRKALLLSTSNRSEASVGYATMDGDTAGGLSPLSGINKSFLRKWLRWLETKGCESLGPVSHIKYINELTPTAELKPQSESQTDEDDLMPYEVLNQIECLFIRDKKSPREIYHLLINTLSTEQQPSLLSWIQKFFRLWCFNQWKRERYAPGFHLDDYSLDPKSWCRFPILSGNFDEELQKLEAEVSNA